MSIAACVLRFLLGRKSKHDFSELYGLCPRSFADEFPTVPKPEGPLSPKLMVVRWCCHDLYGEDMPALAADLLEAGLDSPALRQLAGELNVRCSADVEGLVSRMFRELSVPYPVTEDEAKRFLSKQLAREVIAGKKNPWATARHLKIVTGGWNTNLPEVLPTFELEDELSYDSRYRRPIEEITSELIETFARLGEGTPEELVNVPANRL